MSKEMVFYHMTYLNINNQYLDGRRMKVSIVRYIYTIVYFIQNGARRIIYYHNINNECGGFGHSYLVVHAKSHRPNSSSWMLQVKFSVNHYCFTVNMIDF
jgi:hypothetical protein